MVEISAGGEDAETMREFDLKTGKFVDGGFALPRSKQNVSWRDANTLYVARGWGPGTMTKSGYPFVVKEWKRGTPLDSAKEIYRGIETDISANAGLLQDAQGDELTVFSRGLDFFTREISVLTKDGPKHLAVPTKSYLAGLLDGQLLLTIQEDWTPAGQSTFKQGSLLALQLKDVLADPGKLKPTVVFEPTATEFLEGSSTTRNHLLVTTLNHVQGKAYIYTHGKTGWTRVPLPVGENLSVGVVDVSQADNKFFLRISGFLTPTSLYAGDAETGKLTLAHSQPALFDASNDVVEQLEATSKDGTKVPYFVVHAKTMKYDGSNPTLLDAYGGFEVSNTPYYSATTGKLWLEHGGVFVLANIRGGGEFGPAWHEAGLKTHRQRIYDDFAAVGADLVERKITSKKHLGIIGGSNGGLLMGVEMTQHPEMWGAIVIQVPLLDMLRFEQIAAGASWVGEYGSVSVPEERAFLAGISPYNQLKPGVAYPTPLIFTTTKDDRVGPQHARKFAAKMEEFHEPFYYDEIVEGGHGAGANLKEKARTSAETYVYLSRELMTPLVPGAVMFKRGAWLIGLQVACSAAVAQDPLKLPGKNYAVVFENTDVTVIRAHYGPHEKIPVHDHAGVATVFVYLCDSGPVRINHEEEGSKENPVIRPPTVKGAYRVAPGIAERHSIENLGDLPSDFLRVELKHVSLKIKEPFRGKALASLAASSDAVELDEQGLKVERIVCVGAESCEVKAAGGPSLVVALTSFAIGSDVVKAGDVRWVGVEGMKVKAVGGGSVHLLRIVLPVASR